MIHNSPQRSSTRTFNGPELELVAPLGLRLEVREFGLILKTESNVFVVAIGDNQGSVIALSWEPATGAVNESFGVERTSTARRLPNFGTRTNILSD